MEARDKLLEMIEHGLLKADHVVLCCLKYMSEDDVADMAHCNELLEKEEDDD